MTTRTLAWTGAALEAATGLALVADPDLVIRLLIGAGLSGGGIAVGRVCGFGLFSLGVACWPRGAMVTAQSVLALFIYDLLTALYLGYLRVGEGFVAPMLLPACILHSLLALLLARPAYEALRVNVFESS